jgi:hypothetical protein
MWVFKPNFERQSKENGDELVLTLISLDEAVGRSVFLRTGLSPIKYEGNFFHELWFDIFLVYDDDRATESIQNGLFTKQLLDEDVRWLILMSLKDAVKILVTEIEPIEIFRVAKAADLPEKAMRKHYLVTGCLENLGYYVLDSGFDASNRPSWRMRRR